MLIAIKSAVFTCKERSGSASSARGQITAFGLYCPLSGQAFAVALAQTRFKALDFIVINALLGFFHILFVLRHRFSLGHAPHALILLFKILMIKFLVNQGVIRVHYTTNGLKKIFIPRFTIIVEFIRNSRSVHFCSS